MLLFLIFCISLFMSLSQFKIENAYILSLLDISKYVFVSNCQLFTNSFCSRQKSLLFLNFLIIIFN